MIRRRRLADTGEQLFAKFFKEMVVAFEDEALKLASDLEELSEEDLLNFIDDNFDKVLPTEAVRIARNLLPSKFRDLLCLEFGVNPPYDNKESFRLDSEYLHRY